jgi:hypothetical protein
MLGCLQITGVLLFWRVSDHGRSRQLAKMELSETRLLVCSIFTDYLAKPIARKCPVVAVEGFDRYKIDFHVAALSRAFFPRDVDFCCKPPAPCFHPHSRRAIVGCALVHVSVPRSGVGAAIYRAVSCQSSDSFQPEPVDFSQSPKLGFSSILFPSCFSLHRVFSSCRLRDPIERFVDLARHPELVQQYRQLPGCRSMRFFPGSGGIVVGFFAPIVIGAVCYHSKEHDLYNFDADGVPGAFEPFLAKYLKLTETVIGFPERHWPSVA